MGKRPQFNFDPKRNIVLANLPAGATATLIANADSLRLAAGDLLVKENTPSDCIYFVLSGRLGIYKGEVEIDQQGGGGVLGEMGVLTGQPRTATVKCLTGVEALRVSATQFLGVLDRHPEVLRALIRDMVGKVQVTHQLRVDQVTSIQRARDTLSRCVSAEVLDQILERQTPEQLLAGQLNDAAILFYDIKGFSAVAERVDPRTLLQSLNEHLEAIVESISSHRGTVVNFIGDAVLAVFNCPVTLPCPADAALACYREARAKMDVLQERLRREGQLCFQLGAGINFGKVVSGAIGSESRFSFSVLGDEVNLAARLESLTRHYPVELILSESLYRQLSPGRRAECALFDRVQVKGRKRPVRLYSAVGSEPFDRKLFSRGVRLYLQGDFGGAREVFKGLPGLLPGFLGTRCKLLHERKQPWPGYFTWDVK
jgi:class 3 adenylate cyclase